jgi:catechol 2,3-dioxygenase-like lactoylglutathione lyase family enzyme
MAIAGRATAKPRIHHFCLATDDFDANRIVGILGQHGVTSSQAADPMNVRIRMRGQQHGGAPEGTPELYFGDPDGIVVQIQDSRYCGGAGRLGDKCPPNPEPAPGPGRITVRDFNHFTIFVSDQRRSVAFYQRLFGMPIDTCQGTLPLLRVGAGNQFLALVGAGGDPSDAFIHHACFSVDDFDPDRILGLLEEYGVKPRGNQRGPVGPLQSYVTMRMPNRGGAPGGTPELYFTDPDGILLQIQDARYCGGSGFLGNERGPTR